MRLTRARVQNFKSIVDSKTVDIDETVTVLIGMNEQGKTAFLTALSSFGKQYAYHPRDFPNHLRPALEATPPETIPLVSLWLAPDPSEHATLQDFVGKEQMVGEYKITRYFDGHYDYWTVRNGEERKLAFPLPDVKGAVTEVTRETAELLGRLRAHLDRVGSSFAPAIDQVTKHTEAFVGANFSVLPDLDNIFNTFFTALKGLPGQDPPIQETIAESVRKLEGHRESIRQLLATDRVRAFMELIPKFVLHSATVDKIPSEVNVADFVADPERVSKGMASLCRMDGLTIQKMQELAATTELPHRATFEEYYSGTVSGEINEFWHQAKYVVHFRIEKDKIAVFVADETYGRQIPITERSDGFQWYLSFYATTMGEATQTSNTVLLLDNPGLELHPDGQRDVKRFLQEKLPRRTQVMYVTHSPAMVDPFNLDQVRIVSRAHELEGTKIRKPIFEAGKEDLLEPIRSAIGASLVNSLMFSDFNVLVEGPADRPILEGMFQATSTQERILVNGSVAGTAEAFLPRFYKQSGLPFVVFVDADSGGRRLAQSLLALGISERNIIKLETVFADREGDFELEDVLSAEFYHTAVTETYPDKPVLIAAGAGKRTKLYENAYKTQHDIGFNKRRVADTVKRLLVTGRADAPTLEALKRLRDIHLETLKQLVGQPAGGGAVGGANGRVAG